MRQGIQAELPDTEIREYGCYFLCLLAITEKMAMTDLTDDEVMVACRRAREAGWLGPECFVNDPGAIIHYAGRSIDTPKVLKEMRPPHEGNYIICNKKPMYTHFTAVLEGKPWDPLPPDRPGAKGYHPDSYRVIHRGNIG